jgi:hypothetical protein
MGKCELADPPNEKIDQRQSRRNRVMYRHTVYLLSLALFATPMAHAADQPNILTREIAAPNRLSLYQATEIVSHSLRDNGQLGFRAGGAEFDGSGNVRVEVVSAQGIRYGYVLVDRQTHGLSALKSRS